MYSAQTVGSDSWDAQAQRPVFTPPPARDQDAFTRLIAAMPDLSNRIPAARTPGKLSYSTAMLNAPDAAKRQRELREEAEIRRAAEVAHAKLQLMNGSAGVKLLTDEGKEICIIQGYMEYCDGTVWYPRGDKYSRYPPQMIDLLIGLFRRKAKLLREAKIFYNRDAKYVGRNLIWHFDFRTNELKGDRISEIKLLLR